VKKTHIFIIIFAFIQILLSNVNTGLWWDETVYISLAKSICSLSYNSAGFEQFRAPLYPFFLSLFYCYFRSIFILKIVNSIISVFAVYSLYLIGKKMFGEKVGLYSAFIIALNPNFLFYSYKLLSESLFILLFNIAFFCFLEKKYSLSGVFSGLCFMSRYLGIFIIPIILVYILLEKKYRKEAVKFLIGFICAVIPWFILGYLNYGSPTTALIENFAIHEGSNFESSSFFYYFLNLFSIFGISLFLIIPGIFLVNNKLVILSVLIPIFLLSFMNNKVDRFLVSFSSFFIIAGGVCLSKIPKNVIAFVLVVVFCFGVYTTFSKIINDYDAGTTILRTIEYINSNFSGKTIITKQYSYVSAFSDNDIVVLPDKIEDFEKIFDEKMIILVYDTERGNPDYLKERIIENNSFAEIISFQRSWERTRLFRIN